MKICATKTPPCFSFLTPLLAHAQQTLPPGHDGSAALAATHHSYLQQPRLRRARISSTSSTSRGSGLSSSRPSSPQPQQDLSHVSGLIDRLLALLADDPQHQLPGTAEAALLQQLPHVAAAPAQSPCQPTAGGGTSSVGCQTTSSGSQADITAGRAEGRAAAYADAHASLHGSRNLVERLLLLLHESQQQDGSDAAIRAAGAGGSQQLAAHEASTSGGAHNSSDRGMQQQDLQKPLAGSSGQVEQCMLAREDSCCSSSSLSTCSSLLFLKAAAAGGGDNLAVEPLMKAGVGAAAAGEPEAAGCVPVQPSQAACAPAMAATAASATASVEQSLGLGFDRLASHQPQLIWPQEQQQKEQQQQQLQEPPAVQQQRIPMPQQQLLPLLQLQDQGEAKAAELSQPWQHQQLICNNDAAQQHSRQQPVQQQHSVAEQLQLSASTLHMAPGCCSTISIQPAAAASPSLSLSAGWETGRNAVRLERLRAPLPPSVPSIEGCPQLSVGSTSGSRPAALRQRGTTLTDQLDAVGAVDSDTSGTSTGEHMRFCLSNKKRVLVTH